VPAPIDEVLIKRKAARRRDLSISASLLVLLTTNVAPGEVSLPALFSSGMVLQRNSRVKIAGWAEPGEAITIDLQATRHETVADSSGHWSVRVGPYPAGGPYEMTITGKNRVTIEDLLIGDVWLASG
jgi:sialate O-acetylesterase